jgi:hypothetical protein
MYYSEIVKDERLLVPIAPTKIHRLDKTYVSIKTFNLNDTNLISDTSMINFCQEDILAISKRDELFKVYHEVGDCGEFYWAQSLSSKQYGLLLADCVKHVVSIYNFKYI